MPSIVMSQIVSRSSVRSCGNKAKTYSDCFCTIIWRISEGVDIALAISARMRSARERVSGHVMPSLLGLVYSYSLLYINPF